jgi:hypothetical protein
MKITSPVCIRALSADAELLREMAPPSCGTAVIHSVFERVVNLEFGDGRLATLAYSGSDDAPGTVVADAHGWSGFGLQPGGPAWYADGLIVLGDALVITLEHARPWHGNLPAFARNRHLLGSNLPLARDFVERYGKGIALHRPKQPPTECDPALIKSFQRAVRRLWVALVRNDMPHAEEHARQLVGLGPGATPAGDDFLMGLMGVLNIPGSPGYALRRLGDTVVECALLRTHAVSLVSLHHAARGRVPASVIRLCEALMRARPTTMLAELDHVLRMASSSGTEIAAGVLAGFALHLQLEHA